VFDNKEESLTDRMYALKIAHKSDAAKVTPKVVRLEVKDRGDRERREAWREYEMCQLKIKIYLATGNTPTQDSHPGWCDLLTSDDYLPPPGNDWPVWSKKA
jgi:hypothetical protein